MIGACYRPRESDKSTLPELLSTIDKLTASHNYDIFIDGDFNYPGWDWKTIKLKPNTHHVDLHNHLLESLSNYELRQLIDEPTRKENTLDLMLTNVPDRVIRTRVLPGISDHEIPVVDFSLTPLNKYQVPRKIHLHAKADWIGLRDWIRPTMSGIQHSNESPELLWTKFKTCLKQSAEKYIPTKTSKSKESCPWVSSHLKHLIRKRNLLYQKSKQSGRPSIEASFRQLKSRDQRELRQEHNIAM